MAFLPRPPAHASLVVDLARIVGADAVSTRDVDRLAYSRDCWPRDLLRIRAGQVPAAPSCIVWPESPEEVARILQVAERARVPVVPFGAGSGVAGGARPSAGGITLDLKRMRAVRFIDAANLRMEAECGIIGERLERHLNQRGFTLGHFPSSIVCSSLGGWLAARSAGQTSTRYGKIEDMTLGLEVVSPGKIRRLMLGPRPPVGPDFNALVLGSEGTLAPITAAELRIRPLPEARVFRGYRFHGARFGIDAIRKILRANIRPSVVRLYDALDTLLAKSHGEEEADATTAKIGPSALGPEFMQDLRSSRIAAKVSRTLIKGTVLAVLGSPLVVNRALDALPDDCLLILGFEGQHALAMAEAAAANTLCLEEGGLDLGPGPGEHWYKNRYNVSFKQSKIFDSGAFVDTMEVAATWDRLFPLYKSVRRAIAKDAVVMAHFSHAYGEGCSVYFTFAGAALHLEDALKRYDRIWRNALIAVHEAGGTISHHHGIGESKAEGMAREHGSGGMQILSALKGAFDPENIMNPGKLGVEPTLQRAMQWGERGTREGLRTSPRAFPREIVAAVGERNLIQSGSRTTVRPPDESALAAVLRVACPRSIAVVTDQTGFRPPPGAVQIDLGRFDGIARLSEQSLFVEVEAGLEMARLEAMLNTRGLTVGHIHPRARSRSVGATLARSLLVRRGLAFGDLDDLCFAARGLLANGAPVETRPVPRSATGPEVDRALIGAQGRWGIITKATLRVSVIPPHRESFACEVPSLDKAVDLARVVLNHGVRPAAARVTPTLRGAVAAFELVAATEAFMRAELAILHSATDEVAGRQISSEGLELGGKFDAVVEIASLWTRAAETLALVRDASKGEAWIDFLAPEGVTVVVRVVDAATRRSTVEAGAKAGGRILAGSRMFEIADGESFSFTTGTNERGHVTFVAGDHDRRQLDPYEDITARMTSALDPTGVFRERVPFA